MRAIREQGDWQMFPRSAEAVPVIEDGRWSLEPNPVRWTLREVFGVGGSAMVLRRAGETAAGLCGLLMAEPDACLGVALPHETESHHSVYFSLFGKNLKKGESAYGHIRWTVVGEPGEAWDRNREAVRDWNRARGQAGAGGVR